MPHNPNTLSPLAPRCLTAAVVAATLSLTACGGQLDADLDTAAPNQTAPVASAPAGERVFDESKLHTVQLTLAAADWQTLVDEQAQSELYGDEHPYVRAQLSFDGEKLAGDVGLRLKGHISLVLSEGHSFMMKVDFDRYQKGLRLDGLKKLNLHSDFDGPTLPMMRDYLSYSAWRQYGTAASRTALARVTVNQEDLGIYTLVEQVDGGFVKRHFASPYGALYKPEQVSGTLQYQGSDAQAYPDLGLKWPEQDDHSSLIHAMKVLEEGTVDDVAGVFDVRSVLTYVAGCVALGAGDYYSSTGHNYYLYEAAPEKFTMLPWDMNGSQEPHDLTVCSPTAGLLSGKLLANPEYEEQYFEILADFLAGAASQSWLSTRLDAAQKLLGSAVSASEMEGLRQDIAARTASLQNELDTIGSCSAL